jgi:hypothetical protein
MSDPVTLTLPIPPSPNRWKKHPMAQHVQKNEYRAACWLAAVQQHKPVRDPPERVRISATFYLARLIRDEDNATACLKWAIDCLKQEQTGEMRWRQGIADACGYLTEDDPAHMVLDKPVQVRVKHRSEERLELVIVEQTSADDGGA